MGGGAALGRRSFFIAGSVVHDFRPETDPEDWARSGALFGGVVGARRAAVSRRRLDGMTLADPEVRGRRRCCRSRRRPTGDSASAWSDARVLRRRRGADRARSAASASPGWSSRPTAPGGAALTPDPRSRRTACQTGGRDGDSTAAGARGGAPAPRRGVRLRRRRPDRAARAARAAAGRGLRLPRRLRALPVRRSQRPRARGVRARGRRGAARPPRQAARRRLQLGHRGRAARDPRAPDGDHARRRGPRRRPARRRPGGGGDAQRPRRPARHARDRGERRLRRGHRAGGPVRAAHLGRVPRPGGDHRGRLPVRPAGGRHRPLVLRAAARGRRGHRRARLHALPARPPDAPAHARPPRAASSSPATRWPTRSSTSSARAASRTRASTAREGRYSFLCTGDTEAFRALGTRFLQLPLADVEPVALGARELVAGSRP